MHHRSGRFITGKDVIIDEILPEHIHNKQAGNHQHLVEHPAFRLPGPLWRIIDVHGNFVSYADRRHPVGPGKQLRLPADIAALCGNADLAHSD